MTSKHFGPPLAALALCCCCSAGTPESHLSGGMVTGDGPTHVVHMGLIWSHSLAAQTCWPAVALCTGVTRPSSLHLLFSAAPSQPQPAGQRRRGRRAVHLGCGKPAAAQPVPRNAGRRGCVLRCAVLSLLRLCLAVLCRCAADTASCRAVAAASGCCCCCL